MLPNLWVHDPLAHRGGSVTTEERQAAMYV